MQRTGLYHHPIFLSSDAFDRHAMSQISQHFCELSAETLDQSLAKIEHCVDQLNESQFWWRPEPSMNSVGNLLLHLSGNLRQWGVTPFTMVKDRRDREREFDADLRHPAETVMDQLKKTVDEAKREWSHLSEYQLNCFVTIQGFDVSLMQAILHTSQHFVGHTHQVVQLTRMQLRTGYQFHWTPEEERSRVPV